MADSRKGELDGREVAIAGRLASLTHEEAIEHLERAGATYVSTPTLRTTIVVLGRGGPPLEENGEIAAVLRETNAIQEGGRRIRVVPEEEFLDLLRLEERRATLHRLYTVEQLARILDVPVRRLRAWMRHRLVVPVQVVLDLPYFDFHQVAAAKTLSRLARNGVAPRDIRRSLERISGWLPDADRCLAQLEALEGTLLVRIADGRLAEPSGQLRIEFREEEPATLSRRLVGTEDWFARGVHAEGEGRLEEAVRAYEKALSIEGPGPEICFNLGNALYALGRKSEAAARFREAAALEPDYGEAWNNLGNVLADLGRAEEATEAYRRALALDPRYADAHYNLAETLARSGDLRGARRHWHTYLALDPSSAWAEVVHQRLRKTAGSEDSGRT